METHPEEGADQAINLSLFIASESDSDIGSRSRPIFLPDEACSIIRQTLAQSLTFKHEWTCTLHTIN